MAREMTPSLPSAASARLRKLMAADVRPAAALARKIRWTKQDWYQYQSGARKPGLDKAGEILRALDLPFAALDLPASPDPSTSTHGKIA